MLLYDEASKSTHPSDADFLCKICQMQMQICCVTCYCS